MIDLLLTIDHAQPVGIVTRTVPKMRKTDNQFYDRITKLTEANVFASVDYERSVNAQREREGKEANFQAAERAFGEREFVNGKKTCVIRHTTKDGARRTYMEAFFYGHLKCETRYILDNRSDIAKAEFQEFLYAPSSANRQELDNERVCRTYDVNNIVELRYNGTDYIVMR